MAKIKVKELRELQKNIDGNIITKEFGVLNIEIKKYLNITKKVEIATSMYLSAIDENNLIDDVSLDIVKKIFIIQNYTNITLPKDSSEAYDLITETGIYNFVYSKMSIDERLELEMIISSFIATKMKEYKRDNSLEHIIKNTLEGFAEKVPNSEELSKLIETAKNEFANLDPDKMDFVKRFMEKTGE